jgi:hypothetical protein
VKRIPFSSTLEKCSLWLTKRRVQFPTGTQTRRPRAGLDPIPQMAVVLNFVASVTATKGPNPTGANGVRVQVAGDDPTGDASHLAKSQIKTIYVAQRK